MWKNKSNKNKFLNGIKNYLPKESILKQASHIICISENTKKDLINIYKDKPWCCIVILICIVDQKSGVKHEKFKPFIPSIGSVI